MLAVLDEFTQVTETSFLRLSVFINDCYDGVHYGFLIVKTSLVSQHGAQKLHHHIVLTRELLTQGPVNKWVL